MNDAFLVGSFEGLRDLQGQFERFLDGDGTPFEPIRQRVTFN